MLEIDMLHQSAHDEGFAGKLPPEWAAMRNLQWLHLEMNVINGVAYVIPPRPLAKPGHHVSSFVWALFILGVYQCTQRCICMRLLPHCQQMACKACDGIKKCAANF